MKMIKALKKKLNFWSRKKRKRKSLEPSFNYDYHPLPILPPCSHYHWCFPIQPQPQPQPQPSAPPLPSWLEAEEHTQEAISPLEVQPFIGPSFSNQPQQIVSETTPIDPAFPSNVSSTIHSYQQQYTVSNPPVYGVPVAVLEETRTKERFFGRVVELLGCFCPCLRIREEALLKTRSRLTSYNC